jgi:hypothetical protein
VNLWIDSNAGTRKKIEIASFLSLGDVLGEEFDVATGIVRFGWAPSSLSRLELFRFDEKIERTALGIQAE